MHGLFVLLNLWGQELNVGAVFVKVNNLVRHGELDTIVLFFRARSDQSFSS